MSICFGLLSLRSNKPHRSGYVHIIIQLSKGSLTYTQSSLQIHIDKLNSPLMALFTSDTAQLAAIKSVESRRANPVQRVRILQTTNTLAFDQDARAAVKRQLTLVREQITRTRARLNDERLDWCEHCERGGMPDNHRAQLLKALDALCERECDLLAIPGRGSRRPSPEAPRRKTYTDAGPTAIAAAPLAPSTAQSDGDGSTPSI